MQTCKNDRICAGLFHNLTMAKKAEKKDHQGECWWLDLFVGRCVSNAHVMYRTSHVGAYPCNGVL